MNKTRKARELRMLEGGDPLWNLQEFHIDVPHRELWLVGENDARDESDCLEEPGVEYLMASRIIKNLRLMAHISDEPVLIHMKTCGGDVAEGLAIYDAIKLSPLRVTILSYTHARSMSSIILQAADKRVLMPHSYFMFHRGDAQFSGESRAVESSVEFYKRWDKVMLDIYIAAIQKSKSEEPFHRSYKSKDLRTKLERHMGQRVDVFLSAEETVNWGLADEIFDGDWKGLLK